MLSCDHLDYKGCVGVLLHLMRTIPNERFVVPVTTRTFPPSVMPIADVATKKVLNSVPRKHLS